MDEVEELLADIEDAKAASRAEIMPDELARRAVWLARELPKWPRAWLRRFLQNIRKSFLPGPRKKRRDDSGEAGSKAENGLEIRFTELPDLLTWGETYLPEHFLKPPSAMHQWMAEKLDGMAVQRGTKLNVLGPRGGAKSTLATLAYPLREALHRREPYIWILSDTAEQARAHLENLKAELVDNPHIARDYPQAAGKGPVWRAGKIVLNNGVTVESFGTGQRIRGRRYRAHRPSLLICDDLQNDRHAESSRQRGHAR